MHLYNLTLQRSNAVTCATHGSFSSANEQEVVVSHGQAIELLRPDANGKLLSICHMEVGERGTRQVGRDGESVL